MTNQTLDFLETDIDDEEIASFNQRFRDHSLAHEVISSLRKREMSDRDIIIAFRLIARIPREWEIEKEPESKVAKRRSALAEKLKKLAIEIEKDPDLSGLYFGINAISYGTPKDSREGLTSLADCIREGTDELELLSRHAIASTEEILNKPNPTVEHAIALKKFAVKEIFGLIEKPKRRAPNKETAALTSVLIGEKVTANDVTQIRKAERRRYHYE